MVHSIRMGKIVWTNEEGQPYKGTVAFMTFGLKYPIPYRIQAWKTT